MNGNPSAAPPKPRPERTKPDQMKIMAVASNCQPVKSGNKPDNTFILPVPQKTRILIRARQLACASDHLHTCLQQFLIVMCLSMSSALQQINLSYSPEEDRLLLRVSDGELSEFRVWFTRRYTELLCNMLVEEMNKAGGMQELASSRETLQGFKNGAFNKEYDDSLRHQFPLGETGVLGYRINFNRGEAGATMLQLLPQQGQGITLTLGRSMLFMFYNLIEQALTQANWNMALPEHRKQTVH